MLVDSKHAIELCQRVERLNVLKQFVSNRHSRIQNEVTMHTITDHGEMTH
jgi:hypothetical protein